MEKRVHLLLSVEDHELFNGAAHDARVSLAAWIRMACREKLEVFRPSEATRILAEPRFDSIALVIPKAQELAEKSVPEMVEDAAAVIAAPARKVPLPPSKRRGKSAALKEAADAVVPGPSEPVITTYPLTGIPRVRPSGATPAAAGTPAIPDFEELMVDVSAPMPIQVPPADVVSVGRDGDPDFVAFSKPLPKFKRHPKCETEKCERLGPSCELCRLANTVSF